ncbi:unnamed protein product [Closterium sp. NIES-64]|nr:unnamed protein product [Closterium sp. NIES-64]
MASISPVRPAFVLAVLLSLTCSAIAGRHLLQITGTRYHAFSKLYTTNFVLGGKATLSANVMTTVQSTSFTITLTGVPDGSTPTFTTPGYYNSTSGALVAEFPCTFQLDATSGNYYVNIGENATLTTAYQPVGTLKTLIDAKLFKQPTAFLFSFKVDDVLVTAKVSASYSSY